LADFVKLGETENGIPELKFEQLPFNHPLFLMYSSGTTGIPKCMVHSAGVSNVIKWILLSGDNDKESYRILIFVLLIFVIM